MAGSKQVSIDTLPKLSAKLRLVVSAIFCEDSTNMCLSRASTKEKSDCGLDALSRSLLPPSSPTNHKDDAELDTLSDMDPLSNIRLQPRSATKRDCGLDELCGSLHRPSSLAEDDFGRESVRSPSLAPPANSRKIFGLDLLSLPGPPTENKRDCGLDSLSLPAPPAAVKRDCGLDLLSLPAPPADNKRDCGLDSLSLPAPPADNKRDCGLDSFSLPAPPAADKRDCGLDLLSLPAPPADNKRDCGLDSLSLPAPPAENKGDCGLDPVLLPPPPNSGFGGKKARSKSISRRFLNLRPSPRIQPGNSDTVHHLQKWMRTRCKV